MKKILLNGLIVGAITGAINAVLAYLLGGSLLETPYAGPDTTEPVPVGQFAVASAIFSLVLVFIGALILGLLYRWKPNSAVRIWTIIGVVFLILYGIFPFAAPVASIKAGILSNLLHLVAGFGALYYIPKRSGLQ